MFTVLYGIMVSHNCLNLVQVVEGDGRSAQIDLLIGNVLMYDELSYL